MFWDHNASVYSNLSRKQNDFKDLQLLFTKSYAFQFKNKTLTQKSKIKAKRYYFRELSIE